MAKHKTVNFDIEGSMPSRGATHSVRIVVIPQSPKLMTVIRFHHGLLKFSRQIFGRSNKKQTKMKLIRNNNWGLCPSHWFNSLFSEFSDLFDANFSKGVFKDSGYPYNIYTVKEGETTVDKIEIALAGVDKNRISVSIQNNEELDYLIVSVAGEEKKEDGAVYKKISNKAYKFSWALLEHDLDSVTSEFKEGLLTVKVNKKERKQPVVKTIEVK